MLYERHQFLIFRLQFLDLQSGQLTQAHLHDGAGLDLVEFEAFGQTATGLVGRLRTADNMYYLIDIVAGDHQALEDMGSLFGLAELIARTTDHDLMTMVYEGRYQFFEIQCARTSIDQRHIIDAE